MHLLEFKHIQFFFQCIDNIPFVYVPFIRHVPRNALTWRGTHKWSKNEHKWSKNEHKWSKNELDVFMSQSSGFLKKLPEEHLKTLLPSLRIVWRYLRSVSSKTTIEVFFFFFVAGSIETRSSYRSLMANHNYCNRVLF